MKHTLTLLTALLLAPLLAPLVALHAAAAPASSFIKTGVILINHVGFPPFFTKEGKLRGGLEFLTEKPKLRAAWQKA